MTTHLRTPVVLGWIALALALLGVALWANGGLGLLNRSALASIVVASLLLGSAVFAIAVLSLPTMQHWAFRDGADIGQAKHLLRVVAVLTGCLGLGILVDAALKQL